MGSFKPVTFDWILPSKITKKELDKKKKFYFPGINHDVPGMCIWKLLEATFPAILAPRYHTMDITDLVAQSRDQDNFGIAGWFCMWNDSIGLSLLSTMNSYSSSQLRERDQHEWVRHMNYMTKCVHAAHICSQYQQPGSEHNFCNKASSFILEPMVLIQLPWQPTLLHQWLLSALQEVLLFERASLEFRHWPIPVKLLNCVQLLVITMKKLKERIYLGMAVLMKYIVKLPLAENKYADCVFNEVVLHALEPLRYLISGKAHKLLKILKKASWSPDKLPNCKDIDFLIYRDYFLEEILDRFFVHQCYNPENWVNKEASFAPFKNTLPISAALQKLANPTPAEKNLNQMKVWRLDEYRIYKTLVTYHKTVRQIPVDFMIETCSEMIQEQVLLPGRLSQPEYSGLVTVFQSKDVKEGIEAVFEEQDDGMSLSQLSVLSTMLYWQCYACQVELKTNNSALAKTIAMQLSSMEREQTIRLTHMCSVMIPEMPKLPSISDVPKISTDAEIQEYVQEVNNIKKLTKQTFCNYFPPEWREPVNLKEEMPPIESDILIDFRNRVGRMIYNITEESYRSRSAFPLWQRVQYILPSFVASYMAMPEETKHESKLNYIKFLHNLFSFHEKKFQNWLTISRAKKPSTKKTPKAAKAKKEPEEIKVYVIRSLNIINVKLKEKLVLLVGNFTEIPGFDKLMESLLDWPQRIENSDPNLLSFNIAVTSMLKSWQDKAREFLNDLLETCQQAWMIGPIPDSKINPDLMKLMIADDILSQLHTTCMLAKLEVRKSAKMPEYDPKRRIGFINIMTGRTSLSEEMLRNFMYDQSKEMMASYSDLKKFQKQHGPLKIKLLQAVLENMPESQHKYVKHFVNGNLTSLDKDMKDLLIVAVRKCRKCGNLEKKVGQFIPCKTCIEQKYPDVNYFCKKACQETWWKEEHMAEHLEFELGLGQFAALNLLE